MAGCTTECGGVCMLDIGELPVVEDQGDYAQAVLGRRGEFSEPITEPSVAGRADNGTPRVAVASR